MYTTDQTKKQTGAQGPQGVHKKLLAAIGLFGLKAYKCIKQKWCTNLK